MSSNRKRFFYNGILLTAVALAVRSVGMLFNSYITRTVGAEGIGLFTLIMTVYSFAVTFATSGISLTVTRLVAGAVGEGDGKGVRRIMRHAITYALIFSITASVVLLVFAEYFGIRVLGDGRTILPLRILAVSLVPIALSTVFSGYFVGVKRVARNAAVQVCGQIFKIAITLFFVLRFARLGVEYATIALCISTTLTELAAFLVGLLQFLLDRRRKPNGDKNTPRRFSDVTSMALPLALSAYIRSALLTLEHILIPKRLRDRGESHTDSLAQYGILHGMALPLLMYPMSPLSSFAGLLVPEFAESTVRGEQARMKRIADEALNTTLTYSALVAVLLGIFSEEIGYVLYDSYDTGYYIALMAPIIPIMYLDHVTDSILKGIGEHVYSMWVNICDSVLSVVLVWSLIPLMGIAGYAVVIIVMEGFNFTLSALRLRKRIKFKINLFTAFVLPTLAATASALITRRLFTFSGNGATATWLVLKLVFAVCAFFAVYIPLSKIGKSRKITV
ncbi:MAG: oligosaccharide flippase family protein [Clostridia bacterium]|nr:oligosaccharide flippase family protein [Clostridia bacterium]